MNGFQLYLLGIITLGFIQSFAEWAGGKDEGRTATHIVTAIALLGFLVVTLAIAAKAGAP